MHNEIPCLCFFSMVRLYLKNAPVLILDEPTEGFESDTGTGYIQSTYGFCQE